MAAKKEIELHPLVKSLFDEIENRDITVPKIAKKLDIPKDRIYKWRQQGTAPKEEDTEKIKKWIAEKHPQNEDISANVAVEKDMAKFQEETKKQLIQIEARVNVMMITLAEMVSISKGKAIGLVDSELKQATDQEARRLLSELDKNQG